MALSLPREIMGFILDELGADRQLPSLRACALVHSSWTLASQARIFHTVAVHSQEQWNALVELLRSSSHICPLLRRLETYDELYVSSAGEPYAMLFPRVEHLTYGYPPLEDMMLRSLPSLLTLELINSLWYADNALCHRINSGYSPEQGGVLVLRSLVLIDVHAISGWSSVAEWTRISVQWQSLQSLAISVPKLEDGPAHQQMFKAVTALKTLTLDYKVDYLSISGIAQDLGAISVSRLHIRMDHELFVPVMFALLRETSFPRLWHLHVSFSGPFPQDIVQGSLDAMRYFDQPCQLQDLRLSPSVADSLHSVLVELEGVSELCHTSMFLALFGSANRRGILRVSAGGAQLLECYLNRPGVWEGTPCMLQHMPGHA